MKKALALALALGMTLSLAACGSKDSGSLSASSSKVTVEGALSYADYVAAATETEVTIAAYIQAKQAYSAEYGNTSLYLQDKDGGYFVYRIGCTQEEYDAMTVGKMIKATGYRSEWAGEAEVTDVSAFEMLDYTYTASAKDVTSALGTDGLADSMNQFVSFTGLTVEPRDDGSAFQYSYDGSGSDGSDLYFNVSVNGATYAFTVESDLCGPGTDVYEAVKALNVGDTIDAEGFLYWYEGPNPHITKVTVK